MDDFAAVRAALVDTLRFLIVEQGWECFREEFLFVADAQKASASAQNAEKLRRFIRELSERNAAVAACVSEASKD